MKLCITCLLLAAVTASAMPISFDFENTTIADLEYAGWEFEDGGIHDTITIETNIVKNGSAALRMGWQDWASFSIGGGFGTLDLWVYDNGVYTNDSYPAGSAYGPTWGLQKDLYGSWAYPNSPLNDYVYPYGIGAGLIQKTFLSSDFGYAEEHGQTTPMVKLLQEIVDLDVIDGDPLTFTEQEILDTGEMLHYGWGRHSWFTPAFLGGVSPDYTWKRAPGWCHFQIKYEENGIVEIHLLENGDASANASVIYNINDPESAAPQGAFDGTYGGGVDRLFIWGGSTEKPGMGISEWGDIIVDDVTWTPPLPPPCYILSLYDMNDDGVIDMLDLELAYELGYDLTFLLNIKLYFGFGYADLNSNGAVDIYDFIILKNNYGKTQGVTYQMGDLNRDGVINICDFLRFKNAYGNIYDCSY